MGEGSNFFCCLVVFEGEGLFLLFMVVGQVLFEEMRRLRWLGACEGVQTGVSEVLGSRCEIVDRAGVVDEGSIECGRVGWCLGTVGSTRKGLAWRVGCVRASWSCSVQTCWLDAAQLRGFETPGRLSSRVRGGDGELERFFWESLASPLDSLG